VAEAVLEVIRAEIELRRVPFHRLARRLGQPGAESSGTDGGREDEARLVRGCLWTASSRLPWKPRCLVMVFAGHRMLERRGIASTVYFGAAASTGKLATHAWLRSGGVYVSGEGPLKDFTVLASFARPAEPFDPV